ncbi:MAG: phosphoribosylformylglycinamidine cyclo-ligase [Planctomycetaceae bacterium]|nr:phosphoribosylformylglycinamidine cyclo-ligase [Planctomycetaceae bacterium]
MAKLDYKSAGVDLDVYQESMQRVARHVKRTQTARVEPLAGGFAGLFRLFGDGHRYRDPLLVSGTDGVGTKLKIAQMTGQYGTIGIDLVGMCVNDCLCLGAEPLFFLDYLAMGRDDPQLTEHLVQGIAEGCQQSGLALIGGETAIMPDVYGADDFDLAGFCVAVVEREEVIDGRNVQPGDIVLGLAASGFHSNGYSLIRKTVFEHAGLHVDDRVAELNCTVGEALLTPTMLYPPLLAGLLQDQQLRPQITAIAHITGGGLAENLARVLPNQVDVVIEQSAWSVPPLFTWLRDLGQLEIEEMRRVFNMGIGLVLVVRATAEASVCERLTASGATVYPLGQVVGGTGEARIV